LLAGLRIDEAVKRAFPRGIAGRGRFLFILSYASAMLGAGVENGSNRPPLPGQMFSQI
jgi:hypothetical protein